MNFLLQEMCSLSLLFPSRSVFLSLTLFLTLRKFSFAANSSVTAWSLGLNVGLEVWRFESPQLE